MQCSHRTVVARVHRLQQIEGFGSAHFADDNSFGSHTQAVLDEIAHRDLAGALQIGWARLQTDDMRLLQLQFGGVFAGDHPFVSVDIVRHAIQQRRLTRTGAAGDNDIAADASDDFQYFGPGGRNGAKTG